MSKRAIVLTIFSALITAIFSTCGEKPEHALIIKPKLRVAMIGNTFAERLQHYNYFEPLLYAGYPYDSIVFRNFGWSGDEINFQLRPLNAISTEEHLRNFKPDVIIACYGMNESFKGIDSLATYAEHMRQMIQTYRQTLSRSGNIPQIIIVSPVAHEKIPGISADHVQHNVQLRAYNEVMKKIANEENCPYVDLFEPMFARSEKDSLPLTINGIHLHDAGYRFACEEIARQLKMPQIKWDEKYAPLKLVTDIKNTQFFYLYRAVNSEYIFGRRKEPWVQPAGGPISYPTELATLENIVSSLDTVIWNFDMAAPGNAITIAKQKIENCPLHDDGRKIKADASSFLLKNGFAANLFASEQEFSVQKPVKITFDPQGRMWVATMSSYPQYYPGCPPNDKILILEDSNHDGKADNYTIFADSLYMPLSFELGHGGVFVSQPPNLVFLKDTDNDGKADRRDYLLHGFGTEDVHHSISAFTWGPDGALYMHSGTFLHSQVETPYGLVRNAYGETYRYEPRSMKLETYVSYPYANPWGNVFMRDGTHLIGDVSTGMNYFAPPLATATTFPFKHTLMKDFLSDKQKPKTCGMEIVSSRQFPENMQGSVLFNTFIGFQGITNHNIYDKGSGLEGVKASALLQSTDPNFRPVDLQFGPDGSLYVADWYNPVINHGERALRDPQRDKSHGRIWRLTYRHKPALIPVNLTKLSLPQLLDQLTAYEDRTRYRVRIRLSDLPRKTVLDALETWVSSLPQTPDSDMQLLEALWVYQQLDAPREHLLKQLLTSPHAKIRTAATRVLHYWRHHFTWSNDFLTKMATDTSMQVRLQAVVALSHMSSMNSLEAILSASQLPMDEYLEYAIQEAVRQLSPLWIKKFDENNSYLAAQPAAAALLLSSLADSTQLKMPPFLEPDLRKSFYERKALTPAQLERWKQNPAVARWLDSKRRADASSETVDAKGRVIRIATVPGRMAFDSASITVTAGETVTILFSNDDDMAHNIVIIRPGSDQRVGEAADKMASLPDGYEKNFVPVMPDVIAFTPLISAGKHYRLVFKVPATPGQYPFLCTFPGHWRVMRGLVHILKK